MILFQFFRRKTDLKEEIESHLKMATADRIARGEPPADARKAAMREFGNVPLIADVTRERWAWGRLELFIQDVRFSLRQLRRSPAFTLTAILTLALGIGANTAIFTLVHAVMLKSLPVAKPEQIYRVGDNDKCCTWNGTMDDWSIYSYQLYTYLRDHTPAFDEMAAFSTMNSSLSVRRSGTATPPRALTSEFVSGNYFSMFGLHAMAGRLFTSADDRAGALPVAVMSYHAWREHFGADPSIAGATVVVNGLPFTISGIAPAGFF
jgi:macrolide transport system ATP-binding/permease protein